MWLPQTDDKDVEPQSLPLIAMRSGDLRIGQQQYPGGNRSGPLNMRLTGQKGGL